MRAYPGSLGLRDKAAQKAEKLITGPIRGKPAGASVLFRRAALLPFWRCCESYIPAIGRSRTPAATQDSNDSAHQRYEAPRQSHENARPRVHINRAGTEEPFHTLTQCTRVIRLGDVSRIFREARFLCNEYIECERGGYQSNHDCGDAQPTSATERENEESHHRKRSTTGQRGDPVGELRSAGPPFYEDSACERNACHGQLEPREEGSRHDCHAADEDQDRCNHAAQFTPDLYTAP